MEKDVRVGGFVVVAEINLVTIIQSIQQAQGRQRNIIPGAQLPEIPGLVERAHRSRVRLAVGAEDVEVVVPRQGRHIGSGVRDEGIEIPAGQELIVELLVESRPYIPDGDPGRESVVAQALDSKVVITHKGTNRDTVLHLQDHIRLPRFITRGQGCVHRTKGVGVHPRHVIRQLSKVEIIAGIQSQIILQVFRLKPLVPLHLHLPHLSFHDQNLHHPAPNFLLWHHGRDHRLLDGFEIGGNLSADIIEIPKGDGFAEIGLGDVPGLLVRQSGHHVAHPGNIRHPSLHHLGGLSQKGNSNQVDRDLFILSAGSPIDFPWSGDRRQSAGCHRAGPIILKRLSVL